MSKEPQGMIFHLDDIVKRISELENTHKNLINNYRDIASMYLKRVAELEKKTTEWYNLLIFHQNNDIDSLEEVRQLKSNLGEYAKNYLELQEYYRKKITTLESVLKEFFEKQEYPYYAKKLSGENSSVGDKVSSDIKASLCGGGEGLHNTDSKPERNLTSGIKYDCIKDAMKDAEQEPLVEVIEEPDYSEDTMPIICKHCGHVTRIRLLPNGGVDE